MSKSTPQDIDAVPSVREDMRTRARRQPPHAVVLHNDPVNGFQYVVSVLKKVFRYRTPKASWLTLRAHLTGRSIVWSGTLELAELKAEQVHACGPDPLSSHKGAVALAVTVEPLPG